MEQNRREESRSLSSLLEMDREMVMAQLSADRSQEGVVKAIEKETDRLMYLSGEQAADRSAVVQGMLQVLKNALPLVGAVSEAETWEKESARKDIGTAMVPAPALVCGIAGAACVLFGMIAPGLFVLFRVLLSAAGCALLFLGGWLAGRNRPAGRDRRNKYKAQAQLQQTFLVDPARIWNILQGTMLGADHSLDTALAYDRGTRPADSTGDADALQKADLLFFSELLENAYARRRKSPSEEALTEQIESIRYYLHGKGIETQDYSGRNMSWFELLPGGGEAVTIRPALLRDGEVVRKGVAAGG